MTTQTDFDSILAACGVTDQTLPQPQRDELDELGYTVFPNVIDATWLTSLRAAFEQLIEAEGRAGRGRGASI